MGWDWSVKAARPPMPVPDLAPTVSQRSDEELFRVVKFGGPALRLTSFMPAFGFNMSDGEIRSVVAYLRSLASPVKASQTHHYQRNHATGLFPHAITVGDFDGNGSADLAVPASAERKLSVFLGDGAGGLAAPGVYAVGKGPTWVTSGDLDGDGNADLLTTNT